eukprot:gnl/TRDRNA2_/TRDRNA2_82381_c0_seq1.p1 gnl/TRDRNA2_/TRDRNA2_82381_c0~~gnl/TRDRNA2_/TRDRNA2_82381_c0_seq1.p1  ORF type:complete len:316 (-),score=32.56 gnl/TRDRNA2_/TRDRNA2_82381_c0_seq1:237-1184(-)
MDKFAGQMYLCDFGAKKDGCPEADGCLGPGGTPITPPRLYSYQQWNVQNFVKNSLLSLFPDRADDINERVDPGEYGIESTHVRFVCTFVFVLTGLHDFYEVTHMLKLLHKVPSKGLEEVSWIDRDGDEPVIKVAGMPVLWKIINLFAVALPKFAIWAFIMRSGVMFLMETASIDDTIVNATALGFILQLDELIFEVLTSEKTRLLMSALQSRVSETNVTRQDDDEQLIELSGVKRWSFARAIPQRLVFSISLWIILVSEYYLNVCQRNEDGTWVSMPMHLPKSTDINMLSAMLPYMFPVEAEDKPYWIMPEHNDR